VILDHKIDPKSETGIRNALFAEKRRERKEMEKCETGGVPF
jgi:hypothetical protein